MLNFMSRTCTSKQLYWCPYHHHGIPMSNIITGMPMIPMIPILNGAYPLTHLLDCYERNTRFGWLDQIMGIIKMVLMEAWIWWKPRMQLVLVSLLQIDSLTVNPPYSHFVIIANVLDTGWASAANLMATNAITVGRSGISKRIAGVRRRERKRRRKRKVQNRWIMDKKR